MTVETEMASSYLQNIITASQRADKASAETHRLSAQSNIENALCHGDFTNDQTQRLKRLVRSLEAVACETSQRKIDLLQHTVIPTLVAMRLVEDPNE